MPIAFLRGLSSRERSQSGNRRLGLSLAFVAGATNAGGFLAIERYTSHVTGIVSHLADHIALGNFGIAIAAASALVFFMLGSAATSMLVNWGWRQQLESIYATPLMVEAILLLCFGFLGNAMASKTWMFAPATVALLCFIMGLQNAIITKISNAEIRTTHVTGIVTDLGIELGKMLYWNTGKHADKVAADRRKLRMLGGLLWMFMAGGVIGALGFKHSGFVFTLPLAGLVFLLAAVPVFDDLRGRGRRGKVAENGRGKTRPCISARNNQIP